MNADDLAVLILLVNCMILAAGWHRERLQRIAWQQVAEACICACGDWCMTDSGAEYDHDGWRHTLDRCQPEREAL